MRFLCVAILLVLLPPRAFSHRLEVEIDGRFRDAPLAFGTLAFDTEAGQRIAITRCDLLLSGLALQRPDGVWVGPKDWAAFISLGVEKTRFSLGSAPDGKYIAVRFHIGLPPEINHSDPAKYAAGHALNPLVNGLHWGWQGGYVFAAIEGRWRDDAGALSGFSFHLARDENLVTIELPVDLEISADILLRLRFDLAKVIGTLRIADGSETTHSREGDPIAKELHMGIAESFSVEKITALPSLRDVAEKRDVLIGPHATPYRFTYPATFPQPSLPADNPLTNEGVALGEKLFSDKRLSGNQTQSCLSCHAPEKAFTDGRQFSIGSLGEHGKRNAMPISNLAWKSSFFWDGRASTLRQQALIPIQDPVEMHASLPEVVDRIARDPGYPTLFERAFGSSEVTPDRIARALEQFALTRISTESRFDKAARGAAQLTAEEQRGAVLFNTEYDPRRGLYGADCFHCHGGALFQSLPFANNGLDSKPSDLGLSKVTSRATDSGKFAVPSLRNVALTAPYMHDGRLATLEEVVDHYDHGLRQSETLDPNLAKHPAEGLKLSAKDKRSLVAFLKTLTSEEP